MAIADDLATMRVSEVDVSRYVKVDPSDTVSATIDAMRTGGLSCACVVDDGTLVGVFTQRDVLMRVLGRAGVCERPIAEEMTSSLRTMQAHQSVADGLAIMTEWWVRSVPVLEGERFVGSLSWYTAMQAIAGLLNRPSGVQLEPGLEHGLAFVDFTGLNLSAPVLVSEGDTAEVAIHHMRARAIGSVLVVDERGRLAGIVTEFDLLERFGCTGDDPGAVKVGEIMTSDVVSLSARSAIVDAIREMADRGFSHAPLIGESSRPVGVASFRDIADYFETGLESFA